MSANNAQEIKAVMNEYKISSADISIRCDATIDDLIDVLEAKSRSYIPVVYALNKIDAISIEELDLLYRIPNAVPISSEHGWNVDELMEMMWDKLRLRRVYTKPKGRAPDYSAPVVLRSYACTVENFVSIYSFFVNSTVTNKTVWRYSPYNQGRFQVGYCVWSLSEASTAASRPVAWTWRWRYRYVLAPIREHSYTDLKQCRSSNGKGFSIQYIPSHLPSSPIQVLWGCWKMVCAMFQRLRDLTSTATEGSSPKAPTDSNLDGQTSNTSKIQWGGWLSHALFLIFNQSGASTRRVASDWLIYFFWLASGIMWVGIRCTRVRLAKGHTGSGARGERKQKAMGNLNILGAQAFVQCVDVWRLDPTSPYCYDYPFSKRASLCLFVQRKKIKSVWDSSRNRRNRRNPYSGFSIVDNTRKPLSCWNSLCINLNGKVICWARIHLLPTALSPCN